MLPIRRLLPQVASDEQGTRVVGTSLRKCSFHAPQIITWEVTWVYRYESEPKQDSISSEQKEQTRKMFKVSLSARKIFYYTAVFFGVRRGFRWPINYNEKGVSITGEYCGQARENWIWGVLLMHDNALLSKNRVAMSDLQRCGFGTLNHPSYSPDLVPCVYFCFYNWIKKFRRKMRWSRQYFDNKC